MKVSRLKIGKNYDLSSQFWRFEITSKALSHLFSKWDKIEILTMCSAQFHKSLIFHPSKFKFMVNTTGTLHNACKNEFIGVKFLMKTFYDFGWYSMCKYSALFLKQLQINAMWFVIFWRLTQKIIQVFIKLACIIDTKYFSYTFSWYYAMHNISLSGFHQGKISTAAIWIKY